MKIACPKPISKAANTKYQALIKKAKRGSRLSETHTFQWNGNGEVAACSCGYWALWGSSLESAKRSHGCHRSNRLVSSIKGRAEASTDAA